MAGPQQLSPGSGTPGPRRSRVGSLGRRRTPWGANSRPDPGPVRPSALPADVDAPRWTWRGRRSGPMTTNKRPAPPERRTRCRSRPACWTPSGMPRASLRFPRRARTRTCRQHHRLLAVLNEEATHRSAQGATHSRRP